MASRVLGFLAGMALAVACAGPALDEGPAAARGREASTPLRPSPTVRLPDGFEVRLELALTPEEHERGLMFRPRLRPDHGMLFLFAETSYQSFWMKNTLIKLDLVFLDEKGTVVDVIPEALPCTSDPCPQYTSRAPARAVLELAGGAAVVHRIGPGATLRFARVPDYPR